MSATDNISLRHFPGALVLPYRISGSDPGLLRGLLYVKPSLTWPQLSTLISENAIRFWAFRVTMVPLTPDDKIPISSFDSPRLLMTTEASIAGDQPLELSQIITLSSHSKDDRTIICRYQKFDSAFQFIRLYHHPKASIGDLEYALALKTPLLPGFDVGARITQVEFRFQDQTSRPHHRHSASSFSNHSIWLHSVSASLEPEPRVHLDYVRDRVPLPYLIQGQGRDVFYADPKLTVSQLKAQLLVNYWGMRIDSVQILTITPYGAFTPVSALADPTLLLEADRSAPRPSAMEADLISLVSTPETSHAIDCRLKSATRDQPLTRDYRLRRIYTSPTPSVGDLRYAIHYQLPKLLGAPIRVMGLKMMTDAEMDGEIDRVVIYISELTTPEPAVAWPEAFKAQVQQLKAEETQALADLEQDYTSRRVALISDFKARRLAMAEKLLEQF